MFAWRGHATGEEGAVEGGLAREDMRVAHRLWDQDVQGFFFH